MTLPKRLSFRLPPPEEPSAPSAAEEEDRAGGYGAEQLRVLLEPLLNSRERGQAESSKWPLGYSVVLIIASSLLLWSALVSGISRLF